LQDVEELAQVITPNAQSFSGCCRNRCSGYLRLVCKGRRPQFMNIHEAGKQMQLLSKLLHVSGKWLRVCWPDDDPCLPSYTKTVEQTCVLMVTWKRH